MSTMISTGGEEKKNAAEEKKSVAEERKNGDENITTTT
jgi:hypothetical protein